MARKISNRYLARLVTGDRAPCAFCLRDVDDEVTYGKLYAIGDIYCHYFCCLLSCCLIQKGQDEEGLFGFMYTDILAEIERSKKHKCSYCGHSGASLGCSVVACRKQFHVPCGRAKNAVSLYYGSYKSFCQQHAPRQKIPDHIMERARARMKADRSKGKHAVPLKQGPDSEVPEEMVCVICYESVEGFPTVNTFWPPCCGKDAWFHRTCLQRMALSAGMHYLKCPLCNDKESFYDAVVEQGYYVPDRDAAWELERNAFAEIYERPATCSAEPCLCPLGRKHDAENGQWDIKLCLLCGSAGAHAQCIDQSQPCNPDKLVQSEITEAMQTLSLGNVLRDTVPIEQSKSSDEPQQSVEPKSSDEPMSSPEKSPPTVRFVCKSCLPAAPEDLNALVSSIEAIIQEEQVQSTTEARRPVMSSRMSIRRTKGRRAILDRPSTSRRRIRADVNSGSSESPNTVASRLELNLKSPRRVQSEDSPIQHVFTENKLMSPIKLLEQTFKEKMVCTGFRDVILDEAVLAKLRHKFKKPRPLCERKRIIHNILDGIFDDLIKNTKEKGQVKEWCSPKKNTIEDSKEVKYEHNGILNKIEEFQNKENELNTCKILLNVSGNIVKDENIEKDVKVKYENDDTFNIIEKFKNEGESEEKTTRMKSIENTVDLQIRSKNVGNIESNTENEEFFDNNYEGSVETENSCTLENSIRSKIENCQNQIKDLRSDNNDCRNTLKDTSGTEKCPNIINDVVDDSENCQNIIIDIRNDINEIKCVRNKTADEECRKTGNSLRLSTSDNDASEIREMPTKTSEEIDRKLISMVSENSENINSKESTITLEEKSKNLDISRNKYSKNCLKLKKGYKKNTSFGEVEKLTKNSTFKYKDKVRSKSESSTDIKILKRLLTEQDLCSQLLRELTTGNTENLALNNSTMSERYEIGKPQNNSIETLKSVDNTSKVLDETSKKSLKCDEIIKSLKKSSSRSSKDFKIIIKSSKNTDTSNENSKSHNIRKELGQKSSTPKDSKMNESNKAVVKSCQRPNLLDTSPEIPKSLDQFQLDCLMKSSDTSQLYEIPKHKTIEIQQDSSLEISEKDQHINIHVIKIEDSATTEDSYKNFTVKLRDELKTCLKFSPIKNNLDKTSDSKLVNSLPISLDLESFKKEYLSEVGRELKCNFKHKHIGNLNDIRRYSSPIDFAIDATMKTIDLTDPRRKKRKLSESEIKSCDKDYGKKRKTSESALKLLYDYDKVKESSNDNSKIVKNNDTKKSDKEKHRERKKEKHRERREETHRERKEESHIERKERRKMKKNKRKASRNKSTELTLNSSEKRHKKNKKIKTKFAIQNENIQVKIKWKKKQLSLNIGSKTEAKNEKKVKENNSKVKQYVLQFSEGTSKEVLVKPEKEVNPLKKTKRKVRKEKSPDNKLKQMSIQSFFKVKTDK